MPHGKIWYKLNSDEKEQIAKAEREKRRKIRLIQVREISKKNAASIRNAVRLEKLKQLQKLADNISNEFDKSKTEQLKELEANYENSLRNIGRAHDNASKQMEDENVKQRFKKENKLKAVYRHNAALERLRDDQVRKYVHDNKHIIARKAVLEKEKDRAAQIASLPKPSSGILQDIQQNVYPVSVRNENMNQDDIYYPVKTIVKRHHNDSVEDGRQAAIIQEERLDEQLHQTRSLVVEREQVAKIRFKKALDKELLNRDSEKVIKELSFLQKKQMKRRQKQLATIPKQVFLPPYKRAEALQDKQRIMEEEFEQFYVGDQMALKSDLSVLLEPHPPLESPCQTDALDLTLTSDVEASPARNVPPNQSSIMKDITNVSLPSAQTATTKRQTLQSLFNRIKSQRDDWISDMAEHLHDPEVAAQRNQTSDPATPSPFSTPTESGKNDETEISDSLTEVFGSLEETDATSQGNVLNEINSATIPVANVVQKMEEIQRHLQQLSLTGEDNQWEVLTRSEEAKDMASEDAADFQPAAIASHLKKQIAEVLEQKKRIQEQRNQLEERLRQFDQHQNKTSHGGYILNPPPSDPSQFARPPGDPSRGLIHSPAEDSSAGHSKDGAKDVLDRKIPNSGSNVASLSNSDAEMDLYNNEMPDQPSPNYLATEALKRLPKDIAKVQQYQQKIIRQHTERIKRIEEIQMDIKQHRKTLKDSISGIDLADPISKPDPATSTMIDTDPPIVDPLESTTKQTSIFDVPTSLQSTAPMTSIHPSVSLPFLPRFEHQALPNRNQSQDHILGSDLHGLDGLSRNGMDFLPNYQSCIQESIAGNIFGSGLHGSVFSGDIQESGTDKEKYPGSQLGSNTQHSQPEDVSVAIRPSEPNTPDLDLTSKIYDPCAFTPSFDLESFPTEPIPSSELQEIRKSLPFDETLEDSAQPTPVPSLTASPYKKSYTDGFISESKESDVPDLTDSLTSDFTENKGDFLQIKKQLEDVRKQKEKLCQSLMDNQFELEARGLESVGQESPPSGLDVSDPMPFIAELSNPPKKHPPLLPRAYLYGHSPHELSAIQEKDSSVLSSHLSDMHSKLSMSSSICSTSEPTQTNLDSLISGQLLEEKKLWNILKILKHENQDSNQIGDKTDNSFATSSPFVSVNEFDTSNQPPADISVSRGSLSDPPSISEVSQPSTITKTWAQILLERSQLTAESDTKTSTSILQELPNSTYNPEISLPISTDTDSTVLRNFYFDATGTQFIDSKTLSQDDRKNILALSSSLRSLHCEPKSSETSSDESKMILSGHHRDSNSPSGQVQDSSEGSSLANSEFPSMCSFTKDLLQNHQELSEFLSRILQTSEAFQSEILQQSPRALPLDTTDQSPQNSTGTSSPHVSRMVSLSPPPCQNQRDCSLALHPSTVSDTIANADGELTSSGLFQLSSTTNQSVMGQGPTISAWSPSTVDNIANQSIMGQRPNHNAWSPSTVDNITNITSTSSADADSKTNSSDASLISVIPQTFGGQVIVSSSTVDVNQTLKQSSPSPVAVSSPLPSQPNYQSNVTSSVIKTDNLKPDSLSATRLFSLYHPPKEVLPCYKAAVPQEQTKDEIMNMRPSSQAFLIPSSTPYSLPKSHPNPLLQLSNLSDLSHVFPVSQDITNHSTSSSLISPNAKTKSASLSALTQYSILTTPESNDDVDVSPTPNTQDYLTQQARNISTSVPGYSLSSYCSVSVSEGAAPPFTMETTAGVELSKVSESFLPSATTVITALSSSPSSSSSSSLPFVSSGPTTLLQYQSNDQTQTQTKESPSSLANSSPLSSSSQTQSTIQTQKFLSLKVSSQMSLASPPDDNKDARQLDQSKVSEFLPQIKFAPVLPVYHDRSESNKSSPASSENLSLTQYTYTSPEFGSDKSLPPSSQIDHLTSSVSSNHQLLKEPAADVPEEKPSDFMAQGIDSWKNSEPFGTNSDLWMSMAQEVSMNRSSSESGSFKYTKPLSESCSSHSEKQNSPDIQLQIKDKSSTDSSSKDDSPSFIPLMYKRNTTSSDSSDTTPEKVLPTQKSFQTTLDLDGSATEVSSLMAKVSSPPELTDSHHSGKMVSSPDLSGLSGLSQLSLPSDMMEDYQHLIHQARTLVKRCKANLQQEDGDKIFASGDSGLLSGMTVASTQALFSENDDLVEKQNFLLSKDKRRKEATNRGISEMRGEYNFSFDQISDLNHQLGISDEPNLRLVFSDKESPTVGKEGQADNIRWLDTGLSSTNYAESDAYLTENKVAVSINPQRLDTGTTTSQSKMMSDQRITNSVAAWKLKYTLATQTKK